MSTAWKELERRICAAWGGRRSGPQGRSGPDCTATPVALQVKRSGSGSGGIRGAWVAQARTDGAAARLPWVLVVAGHGSRAPVAVCDHAWLVAVCRQAGLLPPPAAP